VHLSVPIAPSGQAPSLAVEKVPELPEAEAVAVGTAVEAAVTVAADVVSAVAMVMEVVVSLPLSVVLGAERIVVEVGLNVDDDVIVAEYVAE